MLKNIKYLSVNETNQLNLEYIILYDFDNFRNIIKQIDIDKRNNMNMTLLMLTVYIDNYDKVKLLLEEGANIYLHDSVGYTALDIAIETKNTKIIKLINQYDAVN